MGALDQASLLVQTGNLWVGDNSGNAVDLGAVRTVRFTGAQERVRVPSDNRGDVITKVRIRGRVEFDWLEPGDVNKLEVLFKGIVAKSSVAATPVAGATQPLASPFVPNTFYEFANQQGAGTVPTSISLSGATDGALTLDDDYHIVQNPNTGKWGVILNTVAGGGTITTLTQVVTITYSYTPAASLVLTGGSSQTATNRYLKIVGEEEDDSNKLRVVEIEEGICASDLLLAFVNVEDAGDVGVMPVMVEANKASEWTFTDAINPS